MNVEIITIGDEILTGHTVDTNSTYIANKLTETGLVPKYISSVGDSLEVIEEAIRQGLKRTRLVIVTGGLGPTEDDMTKRALVRVFKRNLVFHEDILEELKERYRMRDMEMPAINQNQALLPQGATFFANRSGSAVGICLQEEGRVVIALPGVPTEMKQILDDEVLSFLSRLNPEEKIAIFKLRTTGIPESRLAELIAPKLKIEPGTRLAYLPGYTGCDLRIIAEDKSFEQAQAKAERLAQFLQSKAGQWIFGQDNDTLESVIGELLKDNDKTLSVAESCTGGQLGMTITSVSGSSAYFLGGIIAYDNEVKMAILDVAEEIIEKHGAVSEKCAVAMAINCRKHFQSDYALSVTGVAGPSGGTENKPVGTTFIGLASAHSEIAIKFILGNNREANRTRAVYAAMEMLRREILDIK